MADPATSPPLSRASVQAAHRLIEPYVHRTPVLTNATLSQLASTPRPAKDLERTPWAGRPPARPVMRLWFKCENLQRIGAFKVRGAFHAIERLKQEPGWLEGGGLEKGVVTHSSGNHAQAVALAARTNNMPAHVVMPTISAPPKIAATQGYGATVIFSGSTSVEREEVTARVVAETGARLIPPYDHPDIVLGQGTMGLELQEQVAALMAASAAAGSGPEAVQQQKAVAGATGLARAPATLAAVQRAPGLPAGRGLDAVITPCGGGGMLSGVALSCAGTGILVFGAEPSFEGADDGVRGFYSGRRVPAVSSRTIADGLRTPLGAVPWGIIYERRLVAGMYSVTDDEIRATLRLVYERLKMVVEPSAVVGLAVALYNEDFREMVEREGKEAGWDLGVVFSGGNVSLDNLGKLFAG